MGYYIQGDPAKAKEIKAAFESKGYDARQFDYSCGFFVTFNNDKLVHYLSSNAQIANIIKTHPDYKELELPIKPCFKVGDKIEATIYGIKRRVTIREVDKTNRCYFGTLEECIGFSEQGQWHLAPNPHYDISNFHAGMPVLVRDKDAEEWCYLLYSHRSDRFGLFKFNAGSVHWTQCIPFEENEKLLGTTDMCDEMYINW